MKMNGPKIAVNGTKVTMNGTRSRPSSAEKDTNTCKIVLLGCPGVGKTGKWSEICCQIMPLLSANDIEILL